MPGENLAGNFTRVFMLFDAIQAELGPSTDYSA
jgi:hypothetical protein